MAGDALLELVDVSIELTTAGRSARAVDGVSLTLAAGSAIGLVGESGCGKSLTALAILRLLPPAARIASGRILYRGEDLLALPERALNHLRGRRLAMVFQDPMSALNPLQTAGAQIAEVVRLHEGASSRTARERAIAMLGKVGVPSPADCAAAYPHQLSGGLRQRVLLAIALVAGPELLVADEPTTALDVTVQAEILALLRTLQRELGMALLLISHDLALVAEACDEVAVMYAGRIVEQGATRALLAHPRHPYSAGLLRASLPLQPVAGGGRPRLREIRGTVPGLFERRGDLCGFVDRCDRAIDRCRSVAPILLREDAAAAPRLLRCHHPEESA